MLASITHYLPVTTIRRQRLLPVPGRVVIRKGQKVGATDVIAEANLNPEHLLLDISLGLGLSANKADPFIHVKAGDEVDAGTVIAGPARYGRVVRAPKPGRVVVAGGGQVLLELDTKPFELKAGFPGVVSELIDDRGAEIETWGALIQGVWGNGQIEYGLLNVLSRSPQDITTPDRLDVSLRGSIVLGGMVDDSETLKTASEIPLRGIILSSMDSALIPQAARLKIPVILVEGFGSIPMNQAAYKLLATSDRREVAINAEAWDPYTGTRPEIIIPLPSTGDVSLPKDSLLFSPGQKVRIMGILHKAAFGSIVSIPDGLTNLPSGIRAQSAEVQLDNSNERIMVPLVNLEVLD